jgi:hypothetical protein
MHVISFEPTTAQEHSSMKRAPPPHEHFPPTLPDEKPVAPARGFSLNLFRTPKTDDWLGDILGPVSSSAP